MTGEGAHLEIVLPDLSRMDVVIEPLAAGFQQNSPDKVQIQNDRHCPTEHQDAIGADSLFCSHESAQFSSIFMAALLVGIPRSE